MPVQTQLQQRRGTAASWTSTNPTLAAGEIGFETDTGKFKIGNGSTAWAALAYSAGATAVTYLFNATSGQTTFSGADANGLTLAYTVGAEQVYLNGVLQVRGSDYTATNGTSIVLTSGALTSDVLNVIAYSAMTITDTYTQAQADAKFLQVANTPNASNPVLNSAFQVWQRGTSFTASSGYTADRWYVNHAVAGRTVTRQVTNDTTNLPFIQYCLRYQRDSGNTTANNSILYQSFESINSIPYAGKTVTMSFYARAGANFSAASSRLGVYLISGTGTDQNYGNGYTGAAYPINNGTATLTTTWQRFTFTGTVGATATELTAYFETGTVGTAGAADYFEVTGVQLEIGSTATPFRTYGGTIAGELAACQRYYYRTTGNTSAGGHPVIAATQSTTSAYCYMPLPVTMRTNPTAIDYAGVRLVNYGVAAYSITSLNLDSSSTSPSCAVFTADGASGMTANRPVFIYAISSTNYIGFTAEL